MAALSTTLAFLMALVSTIGGVLIIVVAIQQRTKKLEMQHRERMAMIERGLLPAPETDPAVFEAALRRRGAPSRFISLGIAVVGLGFSLMLLIGFAGGAPGPAVGVGGAIVVLGAAFIANGYLRAGAHPAPPDSPSPRSMPSRPLGSSDPPGPVGP